MPKTLTPKTPDPMANLVVKSTGAPTAAPANVAATRADSGHRAKRRCAPRGGGAARAHPIWLWPAEADRGGRSDTQAAIAKFERDRKLPVTGQMSDRLVRELSAMIGHPIDSLARPSALARKARAT